MIFWKQRNRLFAANLGIGCQWTVKKTFACATMDHLHLHRIWDPAYCWIIVDFFSYVFNLSWILFHAPLNVFPSPVFDAWIGLAATKCGPLEVILWNQWSSGQVSRSSNKPFVLLHRNLMAFFFHLEKDDTERAQKFSASMQLLQQAPEFGQSRFADGADWKVEILPHFHGWCRWLAGFDTAKKYPSLKYIVQSLSEVVTGTNFFPILGITWPSQKEKFHCADRQKRRCLFYRSFLYDWSGEQASYADPKNLHSGIMAWYQAGFEHSMLVRTGRIVLIRWTAHKVYLIPNFHPFGSVNSLRLA